MKKVLQLSGLDCANCARELEEEISKIDGVTQTSIVFMSQKLTVECETERTLKRVIETANRFEDVKVVLGDEKAKDATSKSFKKDWFIIALSAVLFVVGFLLTEIVSNNTLCVVGYGLYVVAYLSVGAPVLKSTIKNIAKGKIFDENFLMTVASIGATLQGEVFEAVAVMLLYQIGETLQGVAVRSSRRNVAELMDIKSEYATVLSEDVDDHSHCNCGHCAHHHEHVHEGGQRQKQVRTEEICVGDILLVKTGEKIPVDGVLLEQTALLDTKSLTGESELKDCQAGAELLSGCINVGPALKMRATKLERDSAVSKILDMMENATARKAKPEKFITKFAKYYTPIVCALAVFVAVFIPIFSGLIIDNRLYFKDFNRWCTSALTFLVISCPCALVISVPLTYFSGVGCFAKHGVLIKGATYLDALAQAKTIAFDKTGTLTEGDFTVCEMCPQKNQTAETLLSLTACVERYSSHPLSKAFEKYTSDYAVNDVNEVAGKGITARVDGEKVVVGNAKFMHENGVAVEELNSPYTLIYVAKSGEYLGCVAVGDKLRDEASETLKALKTLGFTRRVMITGDNAFRAENVAKKLDLTAWYAELLPNDKLEKAEELKKDGLLVYVGDGINDAPIMTASNVSISMGKLGSDVAVEASDLVLISDDLTVLPRCIKIARKTRRIVWQNVTFSIVMKVAFMTLGAIGALPIIGAVFADVGVMLVAVLNSFRTRRVRK